MGPLEQEAEVPHDEFPIIAGFLWPGKTFDIAGVSQVPQREKRHLSIDVLASQTKPLSGPAGPSETAIQAQQAQNTLA